MINWARIKEHVQKVDFWSPNKEIPDEHFEYVDISSINRLHKCIDHNVVPKLLGRDAPSRARQKINIEDVLVSTVRPNLNSIALTDNEFINGTASTGFCVLRAKSTLNPKYLFYWVQTNAFVEDMTKKVSGASYPAVSDKIIKESKIPLPPLETQKKIAEILDAADTLRQKTKTLIEKYDQLTQSLFLDMFGDPVSNPKKWKIALFKELVKNKDHKRIPVKADERKKMKGIYPYYGASGIIDYVDNYIFEGEHLLIGEDGANLLSRSSPIAFIAKGRYWVNNHAHVLEFNENANLVFLKFLINITDLKPYVSGSAQPKLNKKNMEQIPLVYPPLPLQNQFAERVQAIEEQKTKAQASLEKSEELFQSLLQKAFRGEIN